MEAISVLIQDYGNNDDYGADDYNHGAEDGAYGDVAVDVVLYLLHSLAMTVLSLCVFQSWGATKMFVASRASSQNLFLANHSLGMPRMQHKRRLRVPEKCFLQPSLLFKM